MILFIVLGFCAQLIDGCLGMAYGVFLTTFLTANGVPLVQASSGVHFAEVFTTLASGLAHWRFDNVNWQMFRRLALAGIVGGVLGAYVLTSVNGELLKPWVSIYLLLLGIRLLWKVWHRTSGFKSTIRRLIPLGLVAGFFDAVGGGGWGPIVTGTLLARGHTPRNAIGTVNTAEFFVTVAQTATFVTFIGLGNWKLIGGLIIGGILAAPLAAYLCKKINQQMLMAAVAVLIIFTNGYVLWSRWS